MNINDAIALLGQPIHTPQMVQFFEQYGFKYPKKLTKSGHTSQSTFWIENKKRKIDLLFSIEWHSKKYPPVPAERKNTFYPILSHIRIYTDKDIENMPFGLNMAMSFDELKNQFGEPQFNPYILNDDNSPHTYYWWVKLNNEKQIVVESIYNQKNERYVPDIWLSIVENKPLLQFWYPQTGETFNSFVKDLPYDTTIEHQFEPLNYCRVKELFFLRWLIENEYIVKTDENKELLHAVKTGEKDIFAFLQTLEMGYVGENDIIAKKHQAIYDYIHNMNHDVPYYGDDIETLFLTANELKRTKQNKNWLNPDKPLNERVIYNEYNYQKVKAMLDKKLLKHNA